MLFQNVYHAIYTYNLLKINIFRNTKVKHFIKINTIQIKKNIVFNAISNSY